MDEDLDASQGADLLSLALGRQPGASDLDDFVDFEIYFDQTDSVEQQEVLSFLRAKLCEVFAVLLKELEPYLWHRDRFILEPCLEDVPHLAGHLRIGDGTEDEWYVVHLLRHLSLSRRDVSCRVVDADGELILIEAALATPRWVSPSNAENRCWIRNGLIHLLPKPKAGEAPQLSKREGLTRLRAAGEEAVARGKMQKAIDARLQGYPKRALDLSRHVVRAVMPESVARLLIALPQLISVILDHLPSPPTRELVRLRRDLPEHQSSLHFDCENLGEEETVLIGVRFTRLQYARLISLRCQVPQRFSRKRWKVPKGIKEVSEKAMQLGAMLCAGLQAAYLQGTQSATAVLRWREAPETLPWASESSFQKHLQQKELLEASSSRRAYAQQTNLDEHFREAFLRAVKDPALKAVDLTSHWRDRDDPEDWLQVSQEDLDREMKVRQAEFDQFDQKRQSRETPEKPQAEAAPKPAELQKEVAQMGSKIAELLQGSSSLEGVEGEKSKASTGPGSDSDSESSGSEEPLDVLGMEEEAEEDEGEEEGEGEAGDMKDYFSELDDQLENILDGDLPDEAEGGEPRVDGKTGMPLSSRHVKVHDSDALELDMHAMEHVLASFCSENQLEPGPASLLLGELGLGGSKSLDDMD